MISLAEFLTEESDQFADQGVVELDDVAQAAKVSFEIEHITIAAHVALKSGLEKFRVGVAEAVD